VTEAALRRLEFRDPARGERLARRLRQVVGEIGREPIAVMHVCGSHEQAIARFGLRTIFPPGLDVIMGPGCPVCITDMPEVDGAVALARQGLRVATYADMLKVRGTRWSLADARASGARVDVVYSVTQAVELARRTRGEPLVFFATGFETTAVATAAAVLADPPPNFAVLSAHKYIPPAMEVVSRLPDTRIEGFVAAGHAATITGWGIFEDFVARHRKPVVVAGFEPLDILAALVRLLEMVRDADARVINMYPRCVTREGNLRAQEQLWRVFAPADGCWRGIAQVRGGNLVLRDEWASVDAGRRFPVAIDAACEGSRPAMVEKCICGRIMSGTATPLDCSLFGRECVPDSAVGACMVSTEGACRIWHQYGSDPRLAALPGAALGLGGPK
jgi:hydrogenase expression/formation protein HypD